MRSQPSTKPVHSFNNSCGSSSSASVTLAQRLKEKLRFSLLRTTSFLSHLLLIRLLKRFLSRASSFFSMDNLFSDDDFFNDDASDTDLIFDRRHRDTSLLTRDDRLYFVPYRWWKDASEKCFGDSNEIRGALFTTSVVSGADSVGAGGSGSSSEIVLRLRRGDDGCSEGNKDKGEGVSSHEYALLSESLWLRALKWHNDYSRTIKDIGSSLAAEDDLLDVFPLQIRLSVVRQISSLVVKICQMDNSVEHYQRAFQIFGVQSDVLHIWDFSGQMMQLLQVEETTLPNSGSVEADQQVFLELQMYGFLDLGKGMESRKVEKVLERSGMDDSLNGCLFQMNGYIQDENLSSSHVAVQSLDKSYRKVGLLGLTGLLNLGNTCFMNSAIQCLVHTPKLVDYFLGYYKKDINYQNPLGMNGELALAFGDLLRKLWLPGGPPISPRAFKLTLASFAPQFSGYNQHDSQEFLAFLLDGLHEDLNRIKHKPYIEAKDADGRPDDEVADEYWQNHLARNDSIIVDLFQGQYRSKLVCPICKRDSITFDPFMYLSLPLPSTTMRAMTLTVLSSDGMTPPSVYTVTVPQCGRFKDLIQALSSACSLRDNELLLVAEVFNNCILQFLEEPSDSLALIRDDDCLVAYRLAKGSEDWPLVVFMHERMEKSSVMGIAKLCRKFGVPLITRMSSVSSGSMIQREFLKLLHPFLKPDEDALNNYDETQNSDAEDTTMEEASTTFSDDDSSSDNETGVFSHFNNDFEFHITDEQGKTRGSRINVKRPLFVSGATKKLNVLVGWSDQMIRKYDTSRLSLLPEIFKPGFASKRLHESFSLYKCLEAFLKEEPLGPEDMWYCPCCKKHRQASKKLDLWRLPEVLVIHLKRFSYSRFLKSKLETYVDFPISDLDLLGFMAPKKGASSDRYMLYAVSNHYGGMGGGHYTALVNHGNRWYEFDDSRVCPVSEDKIRTSAAYVLFYRRVPDT